MQLSAFLMALQKSEEVWMDFVPHLQANKSVDSFFDLLVGRTSYNINGITVPLQARLLAHDALQGNMSGHQIIKAKAAGVHCEACKWGWR